jgi:hypothetical protein
MGRLPQPIQDKKLRRRDICMTTPQAEIPKLASSADETRRPGFLATTNPTGEPRQVRRGSPIFPVRSH